MRSKSFGLDSLLHDGDALIIVPPFAQLQNPLLGPHLLQAFGRKKGFGVSVLYANMLFADLMGAEEYMQFCRNSFCFDMSFPGERMFARSAHGLEPFGKRAEKRYQLAEMLGDRKALSLDKLNFIYPPGSEIDLRKLADIEEQSDLWADRIGAEISRFSFRVIGCTSSYEQTNASITLFRYVKKHNPLAITVIGGANCTGSMAEGIASLDPEGRYIDYIFAGESETLFAEFLRTLGSNQPPKKRIIAGRPIGNLDDIPDPDYQEYFSQLNHFFPDVPSVVEGATIVYETSRGCWWGQKHNCTFCGLNLESSRYRQKNPRTVINALKEFHERYPGKIVCMNDNIMPPKNLLRFAAELPPMKIMYSLRSDTSLTTMVMLKESGVTFLSPGIESFDTELLNIMNKGVTAKDNILFLRNAKSTGIFASWNLLWAFPGEKIESYDAILKIVEMIHHLNPPSAVYHLSIERFSPYFRHPHEYHIGNIQPLPAYSSVFPEYADIANLAFHFVGDYECASYLNRDVIQKIMKNVSEWWTQWESGEIPMLMVQKLGNHFVLMDTRKISTFDSIQVLSEKQAQTILAPDGAGQENEEVRWAVNHRLGVVIDEHFVPFVTADSQLLESHAG